MIKTLNGRTVYYDVDGDVQSVQFYCKGWLHRIDGHAIALCFEPFTKSWYINGFFLRKIDYKITLRLLNHIKTKHAAS